MNKHEYTLLGRLLHMVIITRNVKILRAKNRYLCL